MTCLWRRSLWLLAPAVALALVLLWFSLRPWPPSFAAACRQTQEGMTEAEVEALFGGEPGEPGVRGIEPPVPGRDPYQKVWRAGKRGIIFVGFAPDGRVREKRYVTYPPDSWLVSVARRLRISLPF